jgi:hypothetical protein
MRKKKPLTATQQARKLMRVAYRDRVQQARARRRLAEQLTPRLQLHLFEDRRQDAVLALAELKAGIEQLGVRIERKA